MESMLPSQMNRFAGLMPQTLEMLRQGKIVSLSSIMSQMTVCKDKKKADIRTDDYQMEN